MGQKVHPLGFRLNTTQNHKSIWYTSLNKYAKVLEQDSQIRDFLINCFDVAYIVDIEIERTYKLKNVFLKIYLAKPELIIGQGGFILLNFKQKLTKRLKSVSKIIIDIFEVTEPDSYAILLAKLIGDQLIRRVAFKRAVREAVKRAQARTAKGVKVQVAGRLNGAEIARSAWVKKGRMPLQTLRAKIDYSTVTAKTRYGIIGIKVWLFKG